MALLLLACGGKNLKTLASKKVNPVAPRCSAYRSQVVFCVLLVRRIVVSLARLACGKNKLSTSRRSRQQQAPPASPGREARHLGRSSA